MSIKPETSTLRTADASPPFGPTQNMPPPPSLADDNNNDSNNIDGMRSATSVGAWSFLRALGSLLGGLVWGPVGIVVGAAVIAVLASVHEWQQQQPQQALNSPNRPQRSTIPSRDIRNHPMVR